MWLNHVYKSKTKIPTYDYYNYTTILECNSPKQISVFNQETKLEVYRASSKILIREIQRKHRRVKVDLCGASFLPYITSVEF